MNLEEDEMLMHSGDDDEYSDEEEVFINEDDILHEYDIDGEVPPDQDDDMDEGDDIGPEDNLKDNAEVQGAVDSIYTFEKHIDELYTVACSPVDPLLVATGGGDNKAFLWKIGNPDAVIELQGHKDTVTSVAFSHGGQLLASGCYDGLVRVWDAAFGTLKFSLEDCGKGFEWIKWHPKGHLIIAGSGSGSECESGSGSESESESEFEASNVYMWNADKGSFLSSFSGHNHVILCGGFTPDGKVLCSGSHDKTMRIWNPKTGECIHHVAGHNYHKKSLTCMEITADSTIAITGAKDGSVHMVNLSSGQVMSSLEGHECSVECIGVSPSFGFAATGGMDNKLMIWEVQRSSPRCICEHEGGVTCVAWLGTTQYVASGCVDGKVRIWDSLSGNCERTFKGQGSDTP